MFTPQRRGDDAEHRTSGSRQREVASVARGSRSDRAAETKTTGLSQLAMAPPADVVRSWAEVEASLTEPQRLVLSDRPIAYWPLYRVRRNRRVLDLTQHGFDGQAIAIGPPS